MKVNEKLLNYYWLQARIELLEENRDKCPAVVDESIKFLMNKIKELWVN